MIPIISLPARAIRLLESNISPGEIAAGVCLGMFLGFTPLNGPMTVLLVLFFLFFKLNRLAVIITLPFFKLLYILGVSNLSDRLGEFALVNVNFLTPLWKWLVNLPVVAYLNINHTLVAGGIIIASFLSLPVFILAKLFVIKIRGRYSEKMRNLKIVKFIKKVPIISKLSKLIGKIRGAGE